MGSNGFGQTNNKLSQFFSSIMVGYRLSLQGIKEKLHYLRIGWLKKNSKALFSYTFKSLSNESGLRMFVGETDDKLSQFSSCKDDLSTIIKESCDNWLSVCLNKMLSPLLVFKLLKFDE